MKTWDYLNEYHESLEESLLYGKLDKVMRELKAIW